MADRVKAPGSDHDRRSTDVGPEADDRKSAAVRHAIRSELAVDAPADEARAAKRSSEESVVELQHVSLAFDVPIIEDVSLVTRDGETVAIVGESGTGKSTILKLVLRLLVPDRGRVLIDGEDITPLTFEEALAVRQKMGMVFQGAALFDSMSVFENVAYPLREHTEMSDDEIDQRVR